MNTTTLRALAILSFASCSIFAACTAGDDPESDEEIGYAKEALSCATPASCADVRNCNPSAGDGSRILYFGGGLGDATQPFRAFCKGMSTGSPTTYLELSTAPGTNNSGQFVDSQGVASTSTYTKVKIEPASLTVYTNDRTFSSYSGVQAFTGVEYAGALGCAAAGANASVDLHGTPFIVPQGAFHILGGPDNSTITYSADSQSVALHATGCATVNPTLDKGDNVIDTPGHLAGGGYLGLSYAAQCTDGLKNGLETGVDCGGPCGACPTSVSIPTGTFSTGVVGGSGGTAFNEICGAGQVLKGFSGLSAGGSPSYLNQLAGRCATVSLTAASSSVHPYTVDLAFDHETTPEGSTTTGTAGSVDCPAGSMVIGFTASTITNANGTLVGEVGLVCAPLVVSLSEGVYSMALDLTQKTITGSAAMLNSAAGGTPSEQDCSSGQISFKYMGRSGSHVNALQLRCVAPVLMCGADPC